MVFFCECTNITLENISLLNSTYWNVFLYGCEDVRVRGLRIYNSFATRNGDGVDIDCCRNVTISDCNIHAGDDCLTIRGDPSKLKHLRQEVEKDATQNINYEDWPIKPERPKCAENICVSNCVLSSSCLGIRVGVGAGEIRNCTFNNIVISNTRFGINIVSCFDGFGGCGTTISNIRFSNFIIDACQPFLIGSGSGAKSSISNIFFDNISANGAHCSYICGEPDWKISNLRFKNLFLTLRSGKNNIAEENDASLTPIERDVRRPAAFYCRNARDLVFDQVDIQWSDPGKFRHDIMLEDSTATIRELRSNGDQFGFEKSISYINK